MTGYAKLSSSIVFSTVWREPDTTRIVWITMLALADADGYVGASLPGLADAARVTLEACETALASFQAPDPYSRTKTNEGRRIAEVDGGWKLLNYDLYRAGRDVESRRVQNRIAKRRQRGRARAADALTDADRAADALTDADKTRSQPMSAQAEAEAEAEATAAAAPDVQQPQRAGPVACPKDLRLTDDQVGIQEQASVPPWAIAVITADFVAKYVGDPDDKRTLVNWRKGLSTTISRRWNNPDQRPKKPVETTKEAADDTGGYGNAAEWS